jgi:acetate kinase
LGKEDIGFNQLNTLVNKHSGVLGISGISSDMRELGEAAHDGNGRAQLALDMYSYRVKKYIGSYSAVLGGADIIIFTGGIGENAVDIRENSINNMEYMGLELDVELNKTIHSKESIISKENSRVKVMVIPTNEELVIAQDTYEIINKI